MALSRVPLALCIALPVFGAAVFAALWWHTRRLAARELPEAAVAADQRPEPAPAPQRREDAPGTAPQTRRSARRGAPARELVPARTARPAAHGAPAQSLPAAATSRRAAPSRRRGASQPTGRRAAPGHAAHRMLPDRRQAGIPTTGTASPTPAGTKPAGTKPAGTAAAASRWNRTFGPPDTGSLPVLRYVENPEPLITALEAEHVRQMSHSSL